MSGATLAEVCIVACAEAFRGDGEILASPMGLIPTLGARLARATFSPDLLLTDGVAYLVAHVASLGGGAPDVVEGYLPYRTIFEVVASGRRHVMMGATQIDRYGNQNISCVGDFRKPKVQLLGMRGAPGNTIQHPTSYFIPNHSTRTFVPKVSVVSGVGYDRAAAIGPKSSRFHEIRRVVSNKGVFDFETEDRTMRLRSIHPGVTLDDLRASTGFELAGGDEVEETRAPTTEELALLRGHLDPGGLAQKELPR